MLGDVLELCVNEYMKTYFRLSINSLSIEVENYPSREPLGGDDSVILLLKSVSEVSVDEVPIIEGILAGISDSGLRASIIEYDSLLAREGRYKALIDAIRRSVEKGRKLLMVMPYLAPVALVSSVKPEVEENLERGFRATVTVDHSNLLYLPQPGVSGPVEIVAKENSLASYERAVWLEREATSMGIRVKGLVYLPDNKSILDYVTAEGIMGIYKRIPVNKLSQFIAALSRCYDIPQVREIIRGEESRHVIYAVNMGEDAIESIVGRLRSYGSKRGPATPSGYVHDWILRGSRRVLAELVRRLALD